MSRRLAIASLLAVSAIAGLVSAAGADGAVYWGGNSAIGAANLDGSMPIFGYPYGVANRGPGGTVCGVAVDGAHLYWANRSGGTVGRLNLSDTPTGLRGVGEDAGFDQSFVSGLVEPCGVAVDGAHLYWADSGAGAIGRANLDGSDPEPRFIHGASRPCGVAVDAGHVYWANQEDGTVGRASLDGGEVDQSFVAGAELPCGVAVDAAHLYWADTARGTIGRSGLDGGGADQGFISSLGGSGLEGPCGLAVDGGRIYWADFALSGSLVGRAYLDGSGVESALVQSQLYGASCGVAVDSRTFRPPPPLPSRPIHFGGLRHNLRTGAVVLTVFAPGRGELAVTSPAIGWSVLKGSAAPWAGGGFKWHLKVWPGGGSPAARRIRRQLRGKGKAPIALELSYQEEGRLPRAEVKRFALIRRR